jgi:hypothetical protein
VPIRAPQHQSAAIAEATQDFPRSCDGPMLAWKLHHSHRGKLTHVKTDVKHLSNFLARPDAEVPRGQAQEICDIFMRDIDTFGGSGST